MPKTRTNLLAPRQQARTATRLAVSRSDMRITTLRDRPIAEIPFLNAGKGAGGYYVERLPIQAAEIAGLPDSLDALIATADLQGRERLPLTPQCPPRLLGEVLPEILCEEILPMLDVAPERTGVILAGDFYTVPALDKRGGSGDVIDVWKAFGRKFRWSAGIAGNHDRFGDHLHPQVRMAANLHYLEGRTAELDGLKVAGLGGMVGNPSKSHRRTILEYVERLADLLDTSVDLLVMHDGPAGSAPGQLGYPDLNESLELLPPTLIVRGHAHWKDALAELPIGAQILNVDCRAVILTRT